MTRSAAFRWWFEVLSAALCVRLLPVLPERPFHLGGVSSCLLQWECSNLSVQDHHRCVDAASCHAAPELSASCVCSDLLNFNYGSFPAAKACVRIYPRARVPPGAGGQEVLLVTVPEFSGTQTACLVNLRTLSCEPVTFSAFSVGDDEEGQMNVSH